MSNDIFIYGAYGYTGQLIVKEALSRGLKPLLGGRNKERLEQFANEHQLPYLTLSLDDGNTLDEVLTKARIVIHCAGPFNETALAMAKACLRTKTHYLDITGEYKVFEDLHKLDQKAREAQIMLLPGAGFDVVPSDCLANYLKHKLPEATHLTLAFTSKDGGVSRGTAKTMIEGASDGHRYRDNGEIKKASLGKKRELIDYGNFKQLSVGISWGDISTAYFSTGIPNIEVYTGSNNKQLSKMKWLRRLTWLIKLNFIQKFLKKQVDKKKPGPSEEKRSKSDSYLYGKVSDGNKIEEARLKTTNGYTLTAESAVLIAMKVVDGNLKTGFQTPASAYGPDLILEISGSQRL